MERLAAEWTKSPVLLRGVLGKSPRDGPTVKGIEQRKSLVCLKSLLESSVGTPVAPRYWKAGVIITAGGIEFEPVSSHGRQSEK